MKRILIVLAFLTCGFSYSQGVSVSGNVVDASAGHAPIAFASVQVKGLDITTETDLNGDYNLSLLEGDYILIFDFIGYAPIELTNIVVENNDVFLNPVIMNSRRLNSDLAASDDD